MHIYRMKMYDKDAPHEAYAVCENASEAAVRYLEEFGVSPDFLSKETYGGIKILEKKKKEKKDE